MANLMIVLSYMILSLWIAEASSLHAANSSSKKHHVAKNRQNWEDHQIKKAERKCKEYVQYACLHRKSFYEKYYHKDRILNGENVPEGMLPHMASIIVNRRTPSRTMDTIRCSGTLISDRYVMSAGHCVYTHDELKIKLGSLYNTDDGTGKWYDVKSIHKHPGFVDEYDLNDIVLLKLSKKVRFNSNVIPICLNTKYKGDYDHVIASGWGHTEVGRPSKQLKMTELRLNGKALESSCRRYIRSRWYPEILKTQTICAGGIENQRDTCAGDSGGPLQVPLESGCPNTYEQIGITSIGEANCTLDTKHPHIGLYGKVEYFVPWIASVVWPDSSDYHRNTLANFTEQLISNKTRS
ncbi:trypsin-1-like [Planococcus citri]|uniref:trypsin-1-like n=1 Tax=Planococcus citri TaxID=170843 RepID=UPI0031FA4524